MCHGSISRPGTWRELLAMCNVCSTRSGKPTHKVNPTFTVQLRHLMSRLARLLSVSTPATST